MRCKRSLAMVRVKSVWDISRFFYGLTLTEETYEGHRTLTGLRDVS